MIQVLVVNVLCFGLPGVGKSHVAAALGHELVRRGRSVYFAPTYEVVQELLAAKRDLALPRALRKFDSFDLVVLDDLGYIQQSPEEAEVLFTLVAERYERRSLALTSNLVFSQWDRIFRNSMATAAAVDRLVHHAVVLEFADVPTFRGPRNDNYPERADARSRIAAFEMLPEPPRCLTRFATGAREQERRRRCRRRSSPMPERNSWEHFVTAISAPRAARRRSS